MGLEKAIEHGKEKRKPYRGAKAVSMHCRNHGFCDYCVWNRQYQTKKQLEKTKIELNEYMGR